ncbi:glutamine amidotransferase [Rhizorhabdus phycosphaerae]|uniref:glutamine amidotransferase n=1 Tax=Rhizorhabdus phycosphaerae TaxID=2711156 RepID=UPI0013ECF950|nr:glutamine amidotransferase [Rhizorhabdus phycosphaerae]
MKTALVIRHVPYEGIAGFRAPVEAAGFVIDRIDVTDPEFPNVDFDSPDLVVMMGGPMGVYETDRHPWIGCEIARLARRIMLDRPTLGVCLGSQMIAAAMGARVYAGPVKEVGFAPVAITDTGLSSPLRHIADVPVLHWHGDTFDLPEGAELLASSDKYAHQAFRRGQNILALQCHPEMGEDPRFDAWLEDEPYIHAAGTSVEALRDDHGRHGSRAVEAGRRMIADWLARIDM